MDVETARAVEEDLHNETKELATEIISEAIRKEFMDSTKDLRKAKAEQIGRLQKQKEEIEQEKKNYRREALKMGYSKEEIVETTKEMENDLKRITEQINEFSEDSEMEKYLERLPEVLLKTFELASNTLQKGKSSDIRDDIVKLIELTTFELTVTNKKELKVKLFDVLDRLISE